MAVTIRYLRIGSSSVRYSAGSWTRTLAWSRFASSSLVTFTGSVLRHFAINAHFRSLLQRMAVRKDHVPPSVHTLHEVRRRHAHGNGSPTVIECGATNGGHDGTQRTPPARQETATETRCALSAAKPPARLYLYAGRRDRTPYLLDRAWCSPTRAASRSAGCSVPRGITCLAGALRGHPGLAAWHGHRGVLPLAHAEARD